MDMRTINGCRSTQDQTTKPSSRLPLSLSLCVSLSVLVLRARTVLLSLKTTETFGTTQKLKKKDTIT